MNLPNHQANMEQMLFSVRPMDDRDIRKASLVEKEAFPTLFPPTSFRRELVNKLARYLVAFEDIKPNPGDDPVISVDEANNEYFPLVRLLNSAKNVLSGISSSGLAESNKLVGFVGLWYMVDDVHVVSVGVSPQYQGRGIGELLLISAIEQTMFRNYDVLTLEVRISNYVAQNLYKKYGFSERGMRKAYYTDNREDALIMTLDSVRSETYLSKFLNLVESHCSKWGGSTRLVT